MEVESELEPVIDNAPSPAPIGPPAINADILGAAATTRSTSRTSPQIASAASSPATSTRSLKRSAEMMEEDDNNDTNYSTNENDTEDRQGTKRKRLSTDKQDEDDQPSTSDSAAKNKDRENPVASTSKAAVSQEVVGDGTNAAKLVEEIGVELTCGCCTGICYNPVIVLPCQHYYCGSCYTLWTRNGGVNCPSCRSPVTSIIPSRAIQSLIDIYLRAVPSRTRLVREKEQADEIYVAGQSIRVPTPRPRSPELTAPQDNDAYYHPCPHCASPNDFNWSCPVPIISPAVNLTFATLLTAATFPAGHARCGSCEHIHAPRAPTSSKCDFCLLSFCGLVVPTRCHAKRVREQRPIAMDSLMDILGNPDVYEAFAVNAVEFDYMLDYLTSKEISPRFIYAEIAEPLTSTVDGWRPLLDRGIFPAVTEAERAAPPPPVSPTRNEAPPQEQQSPQSASPDTVVDETAPETQPPNQDHEMTDSVPETTEPPSEVQSSEPPAENTVPVITPEAQVANTVTDSPRDSAMIVDTAVRSPTPIVVPEPVPTPPVPEPALNALPVDVEVQQPSETPVIPSTTGAATPEQVIVITSLGNNNPTGENDADDDDESTSERSVSPPPTSNPNESTRANANATSSSAPSRSRGPHLNKICRTCAAEVFFWGARAWWIKERAKAIESGELPENVRSRKDCPELGRCEKEDDNAHAREFNHIPHPSHSVATTSATTAPAETQPSDTSNTAEPEQPRDAASIVPTVTDTLTVNETSDSSNAIDATEAQERTSSPERPSRSGSAAAGGESMDVDAPASVEPVETTNEVRPSLLSVIPDASAEGEDHEMGNESAPEPELESPENSLPSNSSGLDGLVADGNGVNGAALNGSREYPEKVMSTLGGSGDVRMVLHDESEPPITSSSARAA